MRLRRLITTFAVAMLLPMALCSCSSVSFVKNLTMTDDGVHKPSEYPVLRATGYASISRRPGATDAIKQIRATDTLNSSNIETSNSVKSEVDGFVHGARVIRQYAVGDTYATELELDTRVIYDLYQMRGAM